MGNPTKEQLIQWYSVERLSYREIMVRVGINNPRRMKKMIQEAGMAPRGRSESVKTQWENNLKRRKSQGKIFSVSSKGNQRRRIGDDELEERYEKKGFLFLYREIIDGYSHVHYICKKCFHRGTQQLGNEARNGCPQCALNDRTFADPRSAKAMRSKSKAWRRLVFERDKHTCQRCGARRELRAHHIENFAQNEALRLDVDNGITLCADCHDCGREGSFHMVYGVYKNNTDQLKEFIATKRECVAM